MHWFIHSAIQKGCSRAFPVCLPPSIDWRCHERVTASLISDAYGLCDVLVPLGVELHYCDCRKIATKAPHLSCWQRLQCREERRHFKIGGYMSSSEYGAKFGNSFEIILIFLKTNNFIVDDWLATHVCDPEIKFRLPLGGEITYNSTSIFSPKYPLKEKQMYLLLWPVCSHVASTWS